MPRRPPADPPRHRRGRTSVWIAVVLSLIAHVPALVILVDSFDEEHTLARSQVDLDEEFSLSLAEERPESREEREDDEPDGQFVSFEAPEEREEPDEARLLDQYDSRADEQMVRRQTAVEEDSPAPVEDVERPEEPSSPDNEATEEREEADGEESESEAADEAAEEREKSESLDEDPTREGLVEEGPDDERRRSDDRKMEPEELFPNGEDGARMFGGDSADYVEDVEEGDKTLLNRKESKFWTFMDRLKRSVARQWSPVEEFRRHDPEGRRYGVEDRFTKLRITLESDGSIRSIYVEEPSGVEFFDDEALRAVRQAAPFHNPPEGMKDRDGLIRLSFGFYLDIERGGVPDLRLRRR